MSDSYYDKIKVGDEVYVACYTSMGASSEGNQNRYWDANKV